MTSAVVAEDAGGSDAPVASLAATSSMSISSKRRSVRASLKVGEGLPHLEVGDHGPELAIEPAKESEDQGPIPDQIAEVVEGFRHRFKTAAEVGDGGRPLFRHAELCREQ